MTDKDLIERIERATLILQEINENMANGNSEILDTKRVAKLTGYSVKTIQSKASQKLIPYYQRDGKLFFKKKEIEEWIFSNRHATAEEISTNAGHYCTRKPLTL